MIDRANVLLVTLLLNASSNVRDRLRREEGQAFVEYAMVLLLVTVALAAGAFITPFRHALTQCIRRHRGRHHWRDFRPVTTGCQGKHPWQTSSVRRYRVGGGSPARSVTANRVPHQTKK